MNIKHIIILGFLALFVSLTSSCKKLEEININPNESSTTHPQFLLTKIQWEAFNAFKGTGPLYALKMIVQTDGENSNQIYAWQRGDFSAYGKLRDVTKMIEEAEKRNLQDYIALGKFFRAYYFYNLTLTFGDVPYSDALKGEKENNYSPKYDSQNDVFVGILKELEEANTLLSKVENRIEGDIIYGGTASQWRKLVNAFRLKVLMTLSPKEADGTISPKNKFSQIVSSEPLFTSGTDDAKLLYLDQIGNRYPEFNSSGYGSGMYVDSTFIKRLQDLKDARLFVLFTRTPNAAKAGKAVNDFTAYEGGNPIRPYDEVNKKATNGNVSKVADRFTKDPTNEPSVLLGYSEQQLILAEAVVRGWISGNADTFYNEGVKAGFKFYETYAKGLGSYINEGIANTYLAQNTVKLSAVSGKEEQIERIMMQRYLRSFHQGGWSAYFDHLRTGYPSFAKTNPNHFAYRWMYPQAEYNSNATNVAAAIASQFSGSDAITAKPWWLK